MGDSVTGEMRLRGCLTGGERMPEMTIATVVVTSTSILGKASGRCGEAGFDPTVVCHRRTSLSLLVSSRWSIMLASEAKPCFSR
jgi:hypothetical protein